MGAAIEAVAGSLDAERSGRGQRRLRQLSTLCALAWGTYWLALLRTMGYGWFPDLVDLGPSLRGIAFVLGLFVLPVVLVLGFRRDPRRWARSVLALCGASFLLALGWAGVEEAQWRRRAPELAASSTDAGLRWFSGPIAIDPTLGPETIYVHRRWPFDTHTLYYDPESGRFGGYD